MVEPVDLFLAHLTSIERSPGTVRSYAFDLRDFFAFLIAHGLDWRSVRLEHLGRFVGWLRLSPSARAAEVAALSTVDGRCSAATINRKLAAVGSFYRFHHRHPADQQRRPARSCPQAPRSHLRRDDRPLCAPARQHPYSATR
ncbi:site-specific integrase [Flindersiella endophytica]